MLPVRWGSARTTACRQIRTRTETPTELLVSGSVKASLPRGSRHMWERSCQVSNHGTCSWDHLSQWPFKAWGHGTQLGWNIGDARSPARQWPLKNMLSRIILYSSLRAFLRVCLFLCLTTAYTALKATSKYFSLYFIPTENFLVRNKH